VAKRFIFDVGGVLVGLRPQLRRDLLHAVVDPDTLPPAERAELEAVNRDFRLGFMDEAPYVAAVTRLLRVSPDTLHRAECDFIVAGDPRMLALVAELRRNHRVVCLSNTQPTHWRHVIDNLLGAGFFDHEYVSHDLGLEKPDPAIYRLVAEREAVDPADIVFIDDTADNLPPAEALGWGTIIHHRSVDETLAKIAAIIGAD
jgi:putative hydrolase of the HAD superfamily